MKCYTFPVTKMVDIYNEWMVSSLMQSTTKITRVVGSEDGHATNNQKVLSSDWPSCGPSPMPSPIQTDHLVGLHQCLHTYRLTILWAFTNAFTHTGWPLYRPFFTSSCQTQTDHFTNLYQFIPNPNRPFYRPSFTSSYQTQTDHFIVLHQFMSNLARPL